MLSFYSIMNIGSFLDPRFLIETFGYLGIFLIVFAESGLLVGFFLPGDSLLFTSGILASRGFLKLPLLLFLTVSGAIIGDSVGYAFGKKVGPKIFSRDNSLLFHKDHLVKAEQFYEKYGAKTIILSRFMPFIRTFAPIVAGVGKMPYKTFISYNFLGGILWGLGLPLSGYFLGKAVPNIDKFLLPIIALIIFLSVMPPLIHFYQENRSVIKKFVKDRVFGSWRP